jgi:hypothetical protein
VAISGRSLPSANSPAMEKHGRIFRKPSRFLGERGWAMAGATVGAWFSGEIISPYDLSGSHAGFCPTGVIPVPHICVGAPLSPVRPFSFFPPISCRSLAREPVVRQKFRTKSTRRYPDGYPFKIPLHLEGETALCLCPPHSTHLAHIKSRLPDDGTIVIQINFNEITQNSDNRRKDHI